ncbi:MAG: YfhO family protein [Planctomycetota bacterium]
MGWSIASCRACRCSATRRSGPRASRWRRRSSLASASSTRSGSGGGAASRCAPAPSPPPGWLHGWPRRRSVRSSRPGPACRIPRCPISRSRRSSPTPWRWSRWRSVSRWQAWSSGSGRGSASDCWLPSWRSTACGSSPRPRPGSRGGRRPTTGPSRSGCWSGGGRTGSAARPSSPAWASRSPTVTTPTTSHGLSRPAGCTTGGGCSGRRTCTVSAPASGITRRCWRCSTAPTRWMEVRCSGPAMWCSPTSRLRSGRSPGRGPGACGTSRPRTRCGRPSPRTPAPGRARVGWPRTTSSESPGCCLWWGPGSAPWTSTARWSTPKSVSSAPPMMIPPGRPSAGPAVPVEGSQTRDHREIRFTTRGDRPGLVVTADLFTPGWRAWVNDTEVPIRRAEHLLMAVEVPAGEARVRLLYTHPGLEVGLWVGALVWLVWLAGTVRLARRRRGRPLEA